MGQKDKLIKKLKANPKTFLFDEAEALLNYLEFSRVNKGKTSGSRVMFVNEDHGNILLHKGVSAEKSMKSMKNMICGKIAMAYVEYRENPNV